MLLVIIPSTQRGFLRYRGYSLIALIEKFKGEGCGLRLDKGATRPQAWFIIATRRVVSGVLLSVRHVPASINSCSNRAKGLQSPCLLSNWAQTQREIEEIIHFLPTTDEDQLASINWKGSQDYCCLINANPGDIHMPKYCNIYKYINFTFSRSPYFKHGGALTIKIVITHALSTSKAVKSTLQLIFQQVKHDFL